MGTRFRARPGLKKCCKIVTLYTKSNRRNKSAVNVSSFISDRQNRQRTVSIERRPTPARPQVVEKSQ
jgi:hypothetical protein